MNLRVLLPKWVLDVRRRKRDTREIEKALRDHSATLWGLTVLLQQEVETLRAEARSP